MRSPAGGRRAARNADEQTRRHRPGPRCLSSSPGRRTRPRLSRRPPSGRRRRARAPRAWDLLRAGWARTEPSRHRGQRRHRSIRIRRAGSRSRARTTCHRPMVSSPSRNAVPTIRLTSSLQLNGLAMRGDPEEMQHEHERRAYRDMRRDEGSSEYTGEAVPSAGVAASDFGGIPSAPRSFTASGYRLRWAGYRHRGNHAGTAIRSMATSCSTAPRRPAP